MKSRCQFAAIVSLSVAALISALLGCRIARTTHSSLSSPSELVQASTETSVLGQSVEQTDELSTKPPVDAVILDQQVVSISANEELQKSRLASLIDQAMASNPEIQRLEAEAAAARERIPQVRSLPDPMVQGTGFGVPQFMADGEMWATLMVSQAIPYIRQLDARGQQAAFEAMMITQEVQSARLRIAADVEEAYYRLYLLRQLLQINESNRQLVDSLLKVATGRVEVGSTTTGDVVLGTLELSRLEEERVLLDQQFVSRKAVLNRLLDLPSDSPVDAPESIVDLPVTQSLDALRSVAFERQPEIVAARLRTEATAWGVRVARLESVPEVTLSYEHMFMDMNPGHDGSDPWRAWLGMNIPLWRKKYRAMEREAQLENLAARRGIDETVRQYDTVLLDLLEQARAAERTSNLYRETILPQSRQALEADQRAYRQGEVTFERVIADARNILTAESAWHRSLTDEAIAIARLKQGVGGQPPQSIEELADPPPLSSLYPD